MSIIDSIEKPTLIIDEERALSNIRRMARKAREQKVRFRPHFKTHQSAEIGEWFRQEGVTAITVSSLDMAQYFAENDWRDIMIAFPFNIRQTKSVQRLAERIHLELLVESVETVRYLDQNLPAPVEVWIKVDTGAGRTGLAWDDPQAITRVAEEIHDSSVLKLRGLLTHAGHTYYAADADEIRRLYRESVERICHLKNTLQCHGFFNLEISVGDTPGCSQSQDLGMVDEIRPGNFVFFDAEQCAIGACTPEEIAVAVTCPVVAKHPNRQEAVIYGGAIHLSKEWMAAEGHVEYGKICLPEGNSWGKPLEGAYVARASQEHGIIHMAEADLERLQIGDMVCVLPVHSCLTVQVMREYVTLAGKRIATMNCA